MRPSAGKPKTIRWRDALREGRAVVSEYSFATRARAKRGGTAHGDLEHVDNAKPGLAG
jgi:hypothetical protein